MSRISPRLASHPRPVFFVAAALFLLATALLPAQDSRRRGAARRSPDFSGKTAFAEAPSKLLGRNVRYLVYTPKGYDAPENATRRYPVLYFLHGLFESADRWDQRGGTEMIDAAVRRGDLPPVVLIAPDGGSTFYVDSYDGEVPYARFFVEELLPHVDATYRTDARREARVIAGASMGGAGALRFAFVHPELFVAVAAHSAAILPRELKNASDRTRNTMRFVSQRFSDVFGDPIDLVAYRNANPLTVAENQKFETRPKIWFDCGENDDYEFDDGARALDELLKKRGIEHVAKILPGDHGWEYIRSAAPAALKFLGDVLRSAPPAKPAAASRPAESRTTGTKG
jgi:enterochelin esterase-like enzyme